MEAVFMRQKNFPVIDPAATGANIVRLRRARGLSVRDLQAFFGFEEPQAIYKWQKGKSLPSVDNLYALGALLEVPMEEILVSAGSKWNELVYEQQADACCSPHFLGGCPAAVDTAGAYGSRRPFSAPRPGCPRRECRGGVASIAPKGSVYHSPILPGWAGDGDVSAAGRGEWSSVTAQGAAARGAEEAGEGLLRCQRPELLYKRGICAVVKCAALWFVCT
ncbi:helix-turn-helix transcriptional regulator [uncultured Flavonifractor sp.]|uniref:helix-turn-helix domain-containing protein n=1 Tax=uncultured Flavonifractor sp. TaxID=1193534 RepID=UPI003455DF4F